MQEISPNQVTIDATGADITVGTLVEVGGVLGWAEDTVETGERLAVDLSGVRWTAQVLADESWGQGELLYWHHAWSVVTNQQTDWPCGYAWTAKTANDTLANVALCETRQQVASPLVITLNYDDLPALDPLLAQGAYVLRDFVLPQRVTGLRLNHAGLLPTNATITIGDSVDPDSLLAATAISGLTAASHPAVIAEPGVSVPDLQITIGVADLTAGTLVLVFDLAQA